MDVTTIAIVVIVAVAVLLVFARRRAPRRIAMGGEPASERAERTGPAPRRRMARSDTARQRMEAASGALSPADLAEIDSLLAARRKIEAVKLVREKTGAGLAEAKEFVEHRSPSGGRPSGNPWGPRQ